VILPFMLLLLLAGSAAGAATGPSSAAIVFDAINDERSAAGVPVLVLNGCLNDVASGRANDMVRRNYFGHVTPDGQTPWDVLRERGCPFQYAAENIAEAPDARTAVTELWNSPEHRRNTLGPYYRKVGVGSASRADGTEIIVEDFTE
jgi:uncharacterized protein YkwD